MQRLNMYTYAKERSCIMRWFWKYHMKTDTLVHVSNIMLNKIDELVCEVNVLEEQIHSLKEEICVLRKDQGTKEE